MNKQRGAWTAPLRQQSETKRRGRTAHCAKLREEGWAVGRPQAGGRRSRVSPPCFTQGTNQTRVCHCRCRHWGRAYAAATAAVLRRSAPMDQSAIVARRGLPLDSTTAIEIGWTVESYMQAHRSMAEGGPGSRRGTCVSAAAKTTVAGERPEEEGELRRGGARALHMLTGHIACLLTSTQSAQGGSARSHGSARTRGTLGGRTPGEVVLPRCKRAQPAAARPTVELPVKRGDL